MRSKTLFPLVGILVLYEYIGLISTICCCFKSVKLIFALLTDELIEVSKIKQRANSLPCCKIELSIWSMLKPSEISHLTVRKICNHVEI